VKLPNRGSAELTKRNSNVAAGYSGTPLVKKLGIKPGARVQFVNDPPEFKPLLGGLPAIRKGTPNDYVHVFVRSRSELKKQLAPAKKALDQDGMIWVSWPKKASGIASDITEDTVRASALRLGLVDVKVCAIDETWSGLKLVIRRENRKK
jgi:hypothetical protein